LWYPTKKGKRKEGRGYQKNRREREKLTASHLTEQEKKGWRLSDSTKQEREQIRNSGQDAHEVLGIVDKRNGNWGY